MPTFILFNNIHVESILQNAAVFIGQNSASGWDSHQKTNAGHGGIYGFHCLELGTINLTDDSREWMDANINDQDVKISWTLNI